MALNKIAVLLFVWLTTLGGLTSDSWATHISQPILVDPKIHYSVGDPVILHGWVEYNAQPAADVLLNLKLIRPDGAIAVDRSYPSDQQGRFEFKFDTRNEAPGTYQVIITSHCLEIHRYACTYKNQTLSIHLNHPVGY